MTIGAGLAPAGASPFGVGAPSAIAPLAALGGAGVAVSSVAIDPTTRDFVVDANGSELGMTDTEQRVHCCMRTVRGSRFNFTDFGLRRPAKVTTDMQKEVYEAVRLAMQPVLTDGSAQLLGVETASEGCRVFALVRWQDMRTRQTTTTRKELA